MLNNSNALCLSSNLDSFDENMILKDTSQDQSYFLEAFGD